jgi:hypothetical protein
MGRLLNTYLRYGVSSDIAIRLEGLDLSVTTFRATPIEKLIDNYGLSSEEASWVKQCIVRQPIEEDISLKLLQNSNFVCCCCKGIKGDSYIIHHIIEYEVSQDNSYENLAILCPNDHDLAHRPSGLTSKLTADQIRKSKSHWEQQVVIHNIAASQGDEGRRFVLKLPSYQALESEIADLKKQISDKEKLIVRSETFFDTELSKLHNQISELERQKTFLEKQVQGMAEELAKIDLDNVSEAYSEAIKHFLNADLSAAISILDKAKLDSELEKLNKVDEELNEAICQNADSRMFKALLLTLDFRFAEAQESANQD